MLAAYEHNGRTVRAADFYAIACDPRRHVAVEACAGAGKTWMLVSRIVRALFDGIDPKSGALTVLPHEILAITFTKRAASEMRERLYRWLQDFAAASDEVLARELASRGVVFPADPALAQAMRTRLAGLYAAVLASGRPVQIRTFHSWFAALLRAAPYAILHQLGLPLHYELLEDDAPAKALVWRRFYQALLEQPERRRDFEAVVAEHGRFQTEKALGQALDKRIEFTRADAAGRVDDAVRHFHALFPELSAHAQAAEALTTASARSRWLAWADALAAEANKTPQKAAQTVRDAFAAVWDPTAALASAELLAALRRGFFVAEEDRLTQHLLRYPAAQQAGVELQSLCAAQRHHAAWAYQQRMGRLSRVLIAAFAALKRERGWIDMSDVERAAMVLLSDPVLSGWVQERLDTRVRHLLIDEFQDTNPLQWHALVSWLGSYSGAAASAPSVFIVGDPKQSIYRFRRAEPQVFRAAQAFVAQGLGGELLSCDHTRRNAPAVIQVVNSVMTAAADNDHYEGFRKHTTDSRASGWVLRLPPIARERTAGNVDAADGEDALAADAGWRDSLTQARETPEETLRTQEARQVAHWIADALALGRKPSDVMVLSRRRAGLGPLQDALRALGVPAQIGEKTGLIDCCEVLDIVAMLDALVSPRHDLSLARALRSPLFAVPDTALIDLALRQRASRLPWFELLQQDWPAQHALHGIGEVLLRWKSWLDALPPHDALQSIYSSHDVLARFAVLAPALQRDAVLSNLRALLAAALEVAGGRFVTPYAFVRALKAGAVLAPATVLDDAVRLLTIHGAKGLEAGAVVLLDTDTPPRASETMGVLVDWPAEAAQPDKFFFLSSEARPPVCAIATRDTEWLQRQREELNALYVALTRARDTLVLSSITPHRDAPGSWWLRLFELAAPLEPDAGPPAALALALPAPFTLLVLPQGPQSAPGVTGSPQASPAADPVTPDSPSARIGKAMHRLLEWESVDGGPLAAARREFGLDAEQAQSAATMARNILSGAGAWAWDADQLAWAGNEVELVHNGVLMRLDRLLQRKDNGQWWVLDHKSHTAPLTDPALVLQLDSYREAVRTIYPDQTVQAAFLTGDGQWVELPETT
ncbi:MAG: UvrD-helicase domain-containing protein [Burkholderiaceae bacterium]